MKLLVFIIVYPIVWILSILPMRILYTISDVFFFINYYIIGYRVKVVENNLQLAFPEKGYPEIKVLAKKSLHHFFDFIVETIKTFTISGKQVQKRMNYKNIEVLKELEKENKSFILTGSHYGNWEWMLYLAKRTNFIPVGAYTKISNKYFEKVIKRSRCRFGGIFVRTSDIIQTIVDNKKDNKLALYALLSDQSPMLHKTHYWANFFNIKVPVITGAEMLAKKHDLNIVNFTVTRKKRGYYDIEFQIITTDAKKYGNYELTDKYLQITEEHIRKQPEFYLWTHKRFKHKDKFKQWQESRKSL